MAHDELVAKLIRCSNKAKPPTISDEGVACAEQLFDAHGTDNLPYEFA